MKIPENMRRNRGKHERIKPRFGIIQTRVEQSQKAYARHQKHRAHDREYRESPQTADES